MLTDNAPREPRHRISLPVRLLTILAVVAMSISAYYFRPGNEDRLVGLLALLMGAALLIFTVQRARVAPLYTPIDHTHIPINWRRVALGGVLLCVLAQSNGLTGENARSVVFNWLWNLSFHLQFLLFIGGIALVTSGFAGGGVQRVRGKSRSGQTKRSSWLLVGILLLAFIVRVVNLETGGTHRFIDEMHYARAVTDMWREGNVHLLSPFSEVTAFTWMFSYLQYWSASLMGPSLSALRIISVFFGVATVWALYRLADEVFDHKTALIAAALLATFPPHVHFSRIGINNVADPFVGIMALVYVARGFKRGRQSDFAIAGVFLGLTQYFYEGGRLFFPALVIGWTVWTVIVGRLRGTVRWSPVVRRQIVIMLAVFVIVAVPFYYTLAARSEDTTTRFSAMGRSAADWERLLANGANPVTTVLEQIAVPLLGYIQIPDYSWFYASGRGGGFVLPAIVPLFLLGVGVAGAWLFTPRGGLLALWLLGAALGNSLISDSLSAPRYLVVYPALVLTIALGIRYTLAIVLPSGASSLHNGLSRSARGLVVVLVVGAMGYQTVYYFGDLLPNFDAHFHLTDEQGQYFRDGDDALLRAVQLPPNTDVHLIGRTIIWQFDVETVLRYFRRDDIRIVHLFPGDLTPDYVRTLSNTVNHAFFIEPDDTETFSLISQYFTLARPALSPYNLPSDRQFVMYFAARVNNRYRQP